MKRKGLVAFVLALVLVTCSIVGNAYTVEALSITVRKPADFRLVNKRTRTVHVLAKRRGTVDGYEVKMRRQGAGWKTYMVYTHGNLSRKYARLVKNSTYEFQIRSFRVYKGRKYGSSWSRVTKVRIKK